MSDYNDQIFALWAQGRLDEGDAMSTGEKWDVFYVLDQAMTELVESVDARACAQHRGPGRPTPQPETLVAGPGVRAGRAARRLLACVRRLPRHRPRRPGGARRPRAAGRAAT